MMSRASRANIVISREHTAEGMAASLPPAPRCPI